MAIRFGVSFMATGNEGAKLESLRQRGRSMDEVAKLRIESELAQEFISAMAADDKARVLRLLSEDCEWAVVPWKYVARGHQEIEVFLGVANKTRSYTDKGETIRIDNWFTNGEHMCVELTNIASLSFLPAVKAQQPICLTLHIKDSKFDWIHEYFQVPFPLSLIIRMVPFITRWRMRRTAKISRK
jgi:hypothetical protein